MIKKIFQKLLYRSGKAYTIDPNIPDGFFVSVLFKRLIMLLRGYLKMGKKVYIGSNCSISNKRNVLLGNNATIDHHTIIDGYAYQKVVIGNGSRIGAYSFVSCTSHFSKYGKGLTMGSNSAVGQFTEFGAAGGIAIGNDVIMGSYVSFHSENHNFSDTTRLIREQGVTSKGIVIGNNVWVGAKVSFLDGSSVGNHCVVAAGAVVNGTFPDYSVIGGVPAKILKEIV
jgi:acetyltransferase-like isoleucine patch superfamily enzyme